MGIYQIGSCPSGACILVEDTETKHVNKSVCEVISHNDNAMKKNKGATKLLGKNGSILYILFTALAFF